jgi:hypothetical protein
VNSFQNHFTAEIAEFAEENWSKKLGDLGVLGGD